VAFLKGDTMNRVNGFPIKKNVDTVLREIYTAVDNKVVESGREWEFERKENPCFTVNSNM
jgi:hypothetical protein